MRNGTHVMTKKSRLQQILTFIFLTVGSMLSSAFKLAVPKYLQRIGIGATTAIKPDLNSLSTMQLAHLKTIPFENLDVVCKLSISMDPSDVQEKLVNKQRGGYCFEQNTLFLESIKSVGFQARPILARVRYNRPPEAQTPYTHMVIIVDIEGHRYLVDVGFGGIQCVCPLSIDQIGIEQTAPDGMFRIVQNDTDHDNITMQWKLQGNWIDMYKFRDVEALPCDMQVANWWSCTWADARWKGCLFVARYVDGERRHLLNNEYCVRYRDGTAKRTLLASIPEVMSLLTSEFGITQIETDSTYRSNLATHIEPFFNRGAPTTFHSSSYAT